MTLKVVMAEDAAAELSGATLFQILWDELAALLGTAATAALLRRAARRALPRNPELVDLTIARLDEQFGYVAPPSFGTSRGPPAALRGLMDELRPLLVEQTGQIAVRQLDRIPELRQWVQPAPRRP
jgi:hypothetical protein